MKLRIFSVITVILSVAAGRPTLAQDAYDVLKTSPRSAERAEEVKIALIGDTEAGGGFASVLKLINAERANAVMINGDLGYGSSPSSWKQRLLANVNPDSLAVVGSLGNHDMGKNAATYVSVFAGLRNEKNGLKAACTGGTAMTQNRDIAAVDEVCTLGNVTIVASAIGQLFSKAYFETRLEQKLKAAPSANWKLAGYHFTLSSMNPGLKGTQSSARFFEILRQHGAIGAQAHTHSVMASCPISSPFRSARAATACHPEFKALEARFVAPGTGLYLDSSVGGKEARNRGRCKNPAESGCKHMIDLITGDGYTRVDGTKLTKFNRLGALFIVFNHERDPKKALAYFKSVDGQTIFKFAILR